MWRTTPTSSSPPGQVSCHPAHCGRVGGDGVRQAGTHQAREDFMNIHNDPGPQGPVSLCPPACCPSGRFQPLGSASAWTRPSFLPVTNRAEGDEVLHLGGSLREPHPPGGNRGGVSALRAAFSGLPSNALASRVEEPPRPSVGARLALPCFRAAQDAWSGPFPAAEPGGPPGCPYGLAPSAL